MTRNEYIEEKRVLYSTMLVNEIENLPTPNKEVIVNEDTGCISIEENKFTINMEYMIFSNILDRLLYIACKHKEKMKYLIDENTFVFYTLEGRIDCILNKDTTIINDYTQDVHMIIYNHDVGPLSTRRYILLLDYLSEIIRYTN